MDAKILAAFSYTVVKEIENSYARFLGNELRKMIDESQGLNPGVMPAYYHNGQCFCLTPEGHPNIVTLQFMPNNMMPPSLSDTLRAQHEKWHRHLIKHQQDMPRIKQGLSAVFTRIKSTQDVRDMLPEHVIRLVMGKGFIDGIPRTRPDVYAGLPPVAGGDEVEYKAALDERLLHWDPKVIRMYEPIGHLVDQYLAFKFLA